MDNKSSQVIHLTGYVMTENFYFGMTKTNKDMATFNLSCYDKSVVRVMLLEGQALKFRDMQEHFKGKKVCVTGFEPQVTIVEKNGKEYTNKSMIGLALYEEIISHKDKTDYGQRPFSPEEQQTGVNEEDQMDYYDPDTNDTTQFPASADDIPF